MASVTSFTGSSQKHRAEARPVSSGVMPGKRAGRVSSRVFDPYAVRAQFPDQWALWCRQNFRSSVELAAAFQVCEKTARLWMEGVTAPSGWVVGAAMHGLVDGVPPFALLSEAA